MILNQFDIYNRRYGATNAVRTTWDPMYDRWILRRYRWARKSGCARSEARSLVWETLWIASMVGQRTPPEFISFRDRPREVTA